MDINWEEWKAMLRSTDEDYEANCDDFDLPPMSNVRPPRSSMSGFGYQSSTPGSPSKRDSDVLNRSRLRELLMEEDVFSPNEPGTVEEILQSRALRQRNFQNQVSGKEGETCIPCLEEQKFPEYREIPQQPATSPPAKKKEVLLEQEAFRDLMAVRKAQDAKLSRQSMIPRPVPSSQRPPPPSSRIPLPVHPATQLPRARSRSHCPPQACPEGSDGYNTRIPLPVRPATTMPPLERRRPRDASCRQPPSRKPVARQACPEPGVQSRSRMVVARQQPRGPCLDRQPSRPRMGSRSRIPVASYYRDEERTTPQEDPWDVLARELIEKKYGCQQRRN